VLHILRAVPKLIVIGCDVLTALTADVRKWLSIKHLSIPSRFHQTWAPVVITRQLWCNRAQVFTSSGVVSMWTHRPRTTLVFVSWWGVCSFPEKCVLWVELNLILSMLYIIKTLTLSEISYLVACPHSFVFQGTIIL